MPHPSLRSLLHVLTPLFACAGVAVACSSSSSPTGTPQACFGAPTASGPPTEAYVGDFKTGSDYLQVWDGTHYVPTFLKGINLGRGIPGAFPSEFAITADEYRRWLDKMGEMGVNLIRIYSLHPPAFYDALAAHNCASPDKTIYLMQGVGLPNDPDMTSTATLDLHNSTVAFEALIDEAIDAIHGNKSIPARRGNAFGNFTTDVSHWTLGMLIGREIIAQEVLATDKLHATDTSFSGTVLKLSASNPSSVWVAERLEHTIVQERANYGVTRPVAFSNWLETDPLHHPTEGSSSLKDVATIDTSKVDAFGAPTGVFESYHVYPYYPDFMSEDPGYQAYWKDEFGSDTTAATSTI